MRPGDGFDPEAVLDELRASADQTMANQVYVDRGEEAFARDEGALRGLRERVNPRTNEKMTIPVEKVPFFSAGNALKESIR